MSSQQEGLAARRIFEAGTEIRAGEGGRYRIEAAVDQGGEAIVYKARSLSSGGVVAVKVLYVRPDDVEAMPRFERVRAIHSKVRGSNVLPVYDSGIYVPEEGGEKYPFFVSPFFSGGRTLEKILREHGSGDLSDMKRKGTLIPYELLLHYAFHIAIGLQTIHDAGVIHRDMKPENVLIAGEGLTSIVNVMDLGVSKFSDNERISDEYKLTNVGCIRGSVGYMAPEVVGGKPSVLSDIWAYGVILYEMQTGRSPFGFEWGTLQSVLRGIVYNTVQPLQISDLCEGVDPRLMSLTYKCLQHDPEKRPQSMREVLDEINTMRVNLPHVSTSKFPEPAAPLMVSAEAETMAAQSTPQNAISLKSKLASEPRSKRVIPEPKRESLGAKAEGDAAKLRTKPYPSDSPAAGDWSEDTKVTRENRSVQPMGELEKPRRNWLPLVLAFLTVLALGLGYDAWLDQEDALPTPVVASSATLDASPSATVRSIETVVVEVPVPKSSASVSLAAALKPTAKPKGDAEAPRPSKTAKPKPSRTHKPPRGNAPLPVPGHEYIPGAENY